MARRQGWEALRLGAAAAAVVIVGALLAPTDLIPIRGKILRGLVGRYGDGIALTMDPFPSPASGSVIATYAHITVATNDGCNYGISARRFYVDGALVGTDYDFGHRSSYGSDPWWNPRLQWGDHYHWADGSEHTYSMAVDYWWSSLAGSGSGTLSASATFTLDNSAITLDLSTSPAGQTVSGWVSVGGQQCGALHNTSAGTAGATPDDWIDSIDVTVAGPRGLTLFPGNSSSQTGGTGMTFPWSMSWQTTGRDSNGDPLYPDGTYTVTAIAQYGPNKQKSAPITVTVSNSGSISGTVVDSSGNGINGASVGAVRTDGLTTPEPAGAAITSTQGGQAGAFVISGLQPGSYTLYAHGDGYSDGSDTPPALAPGAHIAGRRIVLANPRISLAISHAPIGGSGGSTNYGGMFDPALRRHEFPVPDGNISHPFTVTLKDASGHPWAGKTVTVTSDQAAVTAAVNNGGVTDANGQATGTFTCRQEVVANVTATQADDATAKDTQAVQFFRLTVTLLAPDDDPNGTGTKFKGGPLIPSQNPRATGGRADFACPVVLIGSVNTPDPALTALGFNVQPNTANVNFQNPPVAIGQEYACQPGLYGLPFLASNATFIFPWDHLFMNQNTLEALWKGNWIVHGYAGYAGVVANTKGSNTQAASSKHVTILMVRRPRPAATLILPQGDYVEIGQRPGPGLHGVAMINP
jgi:hypothetical protein